MRCGSCDSYIFLFERYLLYVTGFGKSFNGTISLTYSIRQFGNPLYIVLHVEVDTREVRNEHISATQVYVSSVNALLNNLFNYS